MTRSKRTALVLLGACAFGFFVACNVFSSIERCESDADCPSGICDPEGRFCVRPSTEAAPPVDAAEAESDADADAGFDARETGPDGCDARAPFTSFSLVEGFETTTILTARLTADETNVVYSALNGCPDEICLDLFVAHRESVGAPFGAGQPLAGVGCNASPEYWATLSADSQLIFFESGRGLELDGGMCENDRSRIWSSTRQSTSTDFGPPRIDSIFANDAGSVESSPYLHPSGRSLYFVSLGRPGPGGQDIYVATTDKQGLVSTVTEVAAVNTAGAENFPVITLDDKTLYFARKDAPREVWVTHRASPTAPFEVPEQVPGLVGPADAIPAWVSEDRCRLYFTSNRNPADSGVISDYRLWVAERPRD